MKEVSIGHAVACPELFNVADSFFAIVVEQTSLRLNCQRIETLESDRELGHSFCLRAIVDNTSNKHSLCSFCVGVVS